MTLERNPQAQQMGDESMARNLAWQAQAIWPQEQALFTRYGLSGAFRILDLSTLDGEPLLASDDWGDNILALLTQVEKERVLRRVEEQLRKLYGEEQQTAAGILTIISGIMGIEESVARRVT